MVGGAAQCDACRKRNDITDVFENLERLLLLISSLGECDRIFSLTLFENFQCNM